MLDKEEGAKVTKDRLALDQNRDEYVVVRRVDNVSALTFVYFCWCLRNDYMYVCECVQRSCAYVCMCIMCMFM